MKLGKFELGSAKLWLGFMSGLLLGLVANRFATNGNWVDVVAAALGAAIAVLGAVAYAAHQQSRQAAEASALCVTTVWKIRNLALRVVNSTSGDDYAPGSPGAEFVKEQLDEITHSWELLTLFRPYDRLGDLSFAFLIARIDLLCRKIPPMLEDAPPDPAYVPLGGPLGAMGRPRKMSRQRVNLLATEIMKTSDEAMSAMSKRFP